MNEKYFYPENESSERGDNMYGDGGRRYRSEAPSRGSRLGKFFGGEEPFRAPRAPQSAPTGGGVGGVVIYSPSTYEDVQLLIDHLKLREQVIVDFSNISQTSVYRILDFMSGAIYALNGSIQQITKNIFLFAPSGVTITVPPNLGRK